MEVSEAVFTLVKIENYKCYCFMGRMAGLEPPLKYREVMIAIISSFIYHSHLPNQKDLKYDNEPSRQPSDP